MSISEFSDFMESFYIDDQKVSETNFDKFQTIQEFRIWYAKLHKKVKENYSYVYPENIFGAEWYKHYENCEDRLHELDLETFLKNKFDFSNILIDGVPILETDFEIWKEIETENPYGLFLEKFWDAIREKYGETPLLLSTEDIWPEEFYQKLMSFYDDCLEMQLEKEKNKVETFEIDGKIYESIYRFNVGHQGWECDYYGWVCKCDGQKYIVMTSADVPYIADRSTLGNLIEQYQNWIDNTGYALDLMNEIDDDYESD